MLFRQIRSCLALVPFILSTLLTAQTPAPVVSPDVTADHHVTFRLRAPNAKQVELNRDTVSSSVPLTKDATGLWSVTVGPVEPGLYSYSFKVDGTTIIDPSNTSIVPNLLNLSSSLLVPSASPSAWEMQDVPHGVVHRHLYRSALAGVDHDYFVYTPPDYAKNASTQYPVLYLLHGYSDDASAWTAVGRANLILDTLIASQKAKPMIIVMPLGYGVPGIASRTNAGWQNPADRLKSFDLFRQELLTEVMPVAESEYRIDKGREQHAIAGLSMGGAETLFVGLNTPDRFAYVGAFSSGGLLDPLEERFPNLNAGLNSQLKLFWISCGREDRLLTFNQKLITFFKEKGVQVELRETGGAHTWTVWRANLIELSQLLFQK